MYARTTWLILASYLLISSAAAADGVVPAAEPPARATSAASDPSAIQLSLADALKAAIPASELMAVAEAGVDERKAALTSARASWLPLVSARASYGRNLLSIFSSSPIGNFGAANSWGVDFAATQTLFDGGINSAGIAASKAGVRVAEMEVKSQRALTVLEAAQAYYDAALAERRVEIAEASLAQAEQTLKSSKLGFEQGATPEFDMLRAEVARDNQAATLIQYKATRDVAVVTLKRRVGLPLAQPLALVSKLDVDDAAAQVATAREVAQISSSDGESLEERSAAEAVRISETQVDSAKAAWLPRIAASTSFGKVNYPDNFLPDGTWGTNWSLGLEASFTIFDGFRRKATIHVAKAQAASARARYEESKRSGELRRMRAASAVETATATSLQSTRTVAQAKRAYEIAELRYKQGSSTHLELVDARLQLEQALLNQAQSSRDLRVALLRQAMIVELPFAAGF